MRKRFVAAEVGEDDAAVGQPCFGAVPAAEVDEPVLVRAVGVHEKEVPVAVDHEE